MMPRWHSQTTSSAVLWPVRLSHTRSMRRGGSSAGKVKRSARPSCQVSHAALRVNAASGGAAGAGSGARIASSRSLSQPCRIGLVQLPTGWRCTCPSRRGMKQGQNLAGATPDILRTLQVPPRTYSEPCRCHPGHTQNLAGATPDTLVRPGRWVALRLPAAARLRHGLERTGLVLTPDRQAERGAERVGPLDQPLFAAASGSATVTRPSCLRRRTTTPVSHQLRPFCQLYPAACSARPIV